MLEFSGYSMMHPKLTTDEDTNHLFDRVCLILEGIYSADEANAMVHEYYSSFRDPTFCARIHIPVQDDDFFHHQGDYDMALRIHYYLGLKGDPDPNKYVQWRAEYYRQRKQTKARNS
jgi:hypothetical protein